MTVTNKRTSVPRKSVREPNPNKPSRKPRGHVIVGGMHKAVDPCGFWLLNVLRSIDGFSIADEWAKEEIRRLIRDLGE